MALADEKAMKIEPVTSPISWDDATELVAQIPGWTLKDGEIEREFKFTGFRESIDFVNQVADIAQEADHHPDICISYNKVRLVLSTHKIGGLSMNDFIVAAKINAL